MPEQQVCQKTEKVQHQCRHYIKGYFCMEYGYMESSSSIISSYLFAKFIHLRKVSDGGASQGGCVLHQHDLAPVLLHLDHLPVQPLGSQVVEGSHGNGTIFVSEIHFNAWNSCQCVHTLLCTQPATCGGWWWAGQRRYRVNIEWSGAREQNNKSENWKHGEQRTGDLTS